MNLLFLFLSFLIFPVNYTKSKRFWPLKSTNITLKSPINPSNFSCYLNGLQLPFYVISNITSNSSFKFKCEIPPKTKRHFNHKNLVLTIQTNNESTPIITRKIFYLHMPLVQSIFPSYLPVSGAFIYIDGDHFSKLYENVTIRLNKKWFFVCTILSIDRMRCNITGIPSRKVHVYNVSLNINNHTIDSHNKLSFFGFWKLSPKKGPVEKSTTVKISGFGFSTTGLNAYCRVGEEYTIKGEIVDESTLKCSTSVTNLDENEKYNHFHSFGIMLIEAAQENITNEYSYDLSTLWTKNSAAFYFYVSANASTIQPNEIVIDEMADINVYSSDDWSFKETLIGDADYPKDLIAQYFGDKIYCKFGDFGTTKATYVHYNLITCPTPPLKSNLALIYEVEKTLSLTFNGKTFIANRGVSVKFIGVTSPLFYTWIFVGIFIGLCLFVGLVFYIMKYKRKRVKIQ